MILSFSLIILVSFHFSYIFSADVVKSYNETLNCDANSAKHVTKEYPPWLAQLFVSKCEDKRSDICTTKKKVTLSENVTVFEYDYWPQIDVANPICMGVIITEDLILISRSCYFKAQDMILHQDPIPMQRQELVVLTGANPENLRSMQISVVLQEKSMVSDKAGLVIMVLEIPLVFNNLVFPVKFPINKDKLKRKIHKCTMFENFSKCRSRKF